MGRSLRACSGETAIEGPDDEEAEAEKEAGAVVSDIGAEDVGSG